jgi:hypothetical protein
MESATLSEALAGSREETGALIRRLRATEQTLAQHGAELDEERSISAAARAELALLNRQILELRRRLEEIATALAAAEAVKQAQEAEIADLGKRLNIALAREVNRLSRYQSEFFGRLREVLGESPDIRVEGDRFVFSSELLFASGTADLGERGRSVNGDAPSWCASRRRCVSSRSASPTTSTGFFASTATPIACRYGPHATRRTGNSRPRARWKWCVS